MTQTASRPAAPGGAQPDRDQDRDQARDQDREFVAAYLAGEDVGAPQVAPAARAEDRAWRLGDHFMVRVGGLSFETVDDFRYPALTAWADELLDAEDHLDTVRARICDDLAARAGTAPEELRRELTWLRRQLSSGKRVDSDRGVRAVEQLEDLDAELAVAVRGVAVQRSMIAGRKRDAEAVRAADGAAAQSRLRELAADERVRHALLLASPNLAGYLDAYLRGELRDKRARRVERSLLEYLYRMACKPTPFSRFTGVGLGRFAAEADGAPEDGAFTISDRWRSFPRINVSLLTRIAGLLVENESLRRHLGLALTPGWRTEGDTVRFVRRSVQVGDTDNTVSFDAVDDSVFVLSNSDLLEQLFELFGTERIIVWSDLVRELRLSTRASRTDIEGLIEILVRLGLLRAPALALDIHAGDPLEAFYRSVGGLGAEIGGLVLPHLDAMIDAVGRYPRATAAQRTELLETVRSHFLELAAELGSPDEEIPKTVLFEDVRVDNDGIEWGEKTWSDSVGRSLARLEQMMPAFNVTLAHRLVLKGFFLARYGAGGRCDDLLSLIGEFNEDLFDQYMEVTNRHRTFGPDGTFYPQINWLYQKELVALDRGRFAFAAQLRKRIAAAGQGAAEIEIDADFVDTVTAELTDLQVDVAPRAHFIQMGRQDDHPVAVLNRSYGGLRFPFSRFTHCFEDLDGGTLSRQLRAGLTNIEPGQARFAEVTGGQASTNLNLHGRLVDREIVCPGEWSSAPPSRQVHFDDLYVEHDVEQDRLVLREKRDGTEILPVYLGYLVPIALSDVPRTLTLFSQSSTMVIDPWSGVAPETSGDSAVVVRPRLRLGDLYLSRRSWTVPAPELPLRAKGESEPDWFLRWRRWRRDHDLPARMFARVHNAEPDEQLGNFALVHGDKPQYVDADSPLSLRLLESRIEGEHTTVLFEEMLPADDSLYVTSGEGHHVAEMVVETATLDPSVADEIRAEQDRAEQDRAEGADR